VKKNKDQVKLLQRGKRILSYTNAQLAHALGKSETTIKSWLAPEGASKRRQMPESAKLLLMHLLSTQREPRNS
jgi:hypothetical protein